jgi:hypothetical protein
MHQPEHQQEKGPEKRPGEEKTPVAKVARVFTIDRITSGVHTLTNNYSLHLAIIDALVMGPKVRIVTADERMQQVWIVGPTDGLVRTQACRNAINAQNQ